MQGYRCWLISLRKILWRLIDSSNSSIRNIFQKRVNMNYKNFRLLKFWLLYLPDFECFSLASANFSIIGNKVFNIGVQDYECWPSWHTRFLFEMNFKSSVHSSVPCLPIVDSDWTSSKFFNLEVMKKCIFIFEPLFGNKNDSCNSIRHAWKW